MGKITVLPYYSHNSSNGLRSKNSALLSFLLRPFLALNKPEFFSLHLCALSCSKHFAALRFGQAAKKEHKHFYFGTSD